MVTPNCVVCDVSWIMHDQLGCERFTVYASDWHGAEAREEQERLDRERADAKREFLNFESQYTAAGNPFCKPEDIFVSGYLTAKGIAP